MAADILLTENFDLVFQQGDFSVNDSAQQHINLILISDQGQWRNSPLTGANLLDAISSEVPLIQIRKQVQSQIEQDGGTVERIKINSVDEIQVNANY